MKLNNLTILLFTFSTTFYLTLAGGNELFNSSNPIKNRPNAPVTLANENIVGLDCEFVGGKMNDGSPRQKDLLARVSIVDWRGHPIYDKFVLPEKGEIIVDFRTEFSGVRIENLLSPDCVEFDEAQKKVKKLIEGKIVVGHQLDSDFGVLRLHHPHRLRRDTAKFMKLREGWFNGLQRTPSLKRLAAHHLGLAIQQGEHDSVEDAQIPVQIYFKWQQIWEKEMQIEGEEDLANSFVQMNMNGKSSSRNSDASGDEGKLTKEDDGQFKMYKIMAQYEMNKNVLSKNYKTIAARNKFSQKKMKEFSKFYEVTDKLLKMELILPKTTSIETYVAKFRAVTNIWYAFEELELEHAKIFENNITARKLEYYHQTKMKKLYNAYELVVNKWNDEYRRRGLIYYGQAKLCKISLGNIIEAKKGEKRIVAMFDANDEAILMQAEQTVSTAANPSMYNEFMKTFDKIERNAEFMQNLIFPSAQKLPPTVKYEQSNKEKRDELLLAAFGERKFNNEQKEAIYGIVNGTHGNVPFILWGPPGTGKTVTIVEAIRQLLAKNAQNRILICTPSNSAADLVAKRILADGNIIARVEQLRRLYSIGKDVADVDPTLDRRILCIEWVDYMGMQFQQFGVCDNLLEARIVVMTLGASAMLEDYQIGREFFSHIFIDEAAQSLETETLIPLARYAAPSTRVILAGDHMQLGPVVTAMFLKGAYSNSCQSMIYRLMSTNPQHKAYSDGRTSIKLVQNYRSHSAILTFASTQFYNSELISANSQNRSTFTQWKHLPTKNFPIIFQIVEEGVEQQSAMSKSFWNAEELEMVDEYIRLLLNPWEGAPTDLKIEQIGVISPYKLQTQQIRSALSHDYEAITVDSVERFQGSDRRVILITLTRSENIGFLREEQRINTSITRAEELLIVIASRKLLNNRNFENTYWHRFYEYCQANGAVLSTKKETQMFVPHRNTYQGNASQNADRFHHFHSNMPVQMSQMGVGGQRIESKYKQMKGPMMFGNV